MPLLEEVVVKIDGKDICERMPLEYIETFNVVNELPYALVRVKDFLNVSTEGDNLFANDSCFKIGAKVEIEIGDSGSTKNIFSGFILEKSFRLDSFDGFCFVEIKVVSRAHEMDIVVNDEFFLDKKDSEVIKTIVSKHSGLSVKTGDMSLQHESLIKHSVSDWQFVNMRARAYGFVVVVDGDSMTVDTPNMSSCGVEAILGENIVEFNLHVNGGRQFENASVNVWDIKKQVVNTVKAPSASEMSFGNVKYNDITKETSKQELVICDDSISEDVAKVISSAALSLDRLSKISGYVVIQGNADVKCNSSIKISRGAECFNGEAYVRGVQHFYDDGDWLTKVFIGYEESTTTSSRTPILTDRINGLKYGKVIKVAGDKEGEFRVLVNIPIYCKPGEGVWCRMSSYYASADVGVVFFPEVDDEVIVGFIENNICSGVILGVVYSSKNKPPLEKIEEKNDKKVICTRSKMQISFDDKDKVLQLTTPDKKEITISDKDDCVQMKSGNDIISISKGGIKIKCSKDISIEGKNVSIKSTGKVAVDASSDVNIGGVNVNVKGSMGANVEGGTSANLKSSGMTAVKGSMVNIN